MIKKILSFFILILLTGSLFAQSPFIQNFLPEEYKAHSQNWSIVQDQRGIMYFGNNNGVLEYDGVNWRTIKTPSIVFSLCADNSGCIYVGLNGDFGYLQADSFGNLQYKSLKDRLPKEYQEFKTIWTIHLVGEKVVFFTAGKIFVLENDSIDVLMSGKNIRSAHQVRGKYYILEKEKGFMSLDDDHFEPMSGADLFSKMVPVVMLPYGKDEILILTYASGIKIYNPKKLPHLRKPDGFDVVNKFLRENSIYYSGVKLSNGNFAVCTRAGGILIFDKQGKVQNHYGKQNGLQSNSVHYLATDLNGQIWVALNNGISLISNNLPFVNYTDNDGLDGSIYSVQRYEDQLYVGTSDKLYIQNKENKFKSIPGTVGQNFFLQQAKGKLLAGIFGKGIFEVNDKALQQSLDLRGLRSIEETKLRNHPNYILTQNSNRGLALIEFKNEHWVFKNNIKGFDKNSIYLEEDDRGYFWLKTQIHLYKLRLNEALDSVIYSQDFTANKYHFPETSAAPYRLSSGEIIFTTKKGIYRYLSDKDAFELHPDFSMLLGEVIEFKEDKKGNIWFEELKDNVYEKGVLRLLNGKYKIDKTPFYKFTDRSIPNPYALYPYSDSLVYIGTNKGLLGYYPKQMVNYDIPFNTLIREIFVNDSLIYGGFAKDSLSIFNDPVVLKYKDNNLFFHYAATFYEDSESNMYSYRLIGSSDTTWSAWKKDAKKEYTNLYEGKYIFEVKSQNIYRKLGHKESFIFEIQPPWERTLWAYILYGIVAIIFVLLVIRINSARLNRLNETLKKTVEERTADILEQKEEIHAQAENLKVTNEKLVEINATKDKFFSIISHDLRSPFNCILGFTDLLNSGYDSIDDSEKKVMIRELNSSSQHAYDLLSNLLTWARTQRGNIELNKELLNLKELVEISIAPYVLNASGKGIKIGIDIPREANLLVDKNTSITFIGNLVNNAIKFTPKGGRISINYHENGDNIELHIIDTGVGMTSEVIEKLFRIDTNVSTEGTNNEKGTGLGLILCKEFIEQNGGSIQVKSEVNKGSEFIISFPQ